MLIEYEIKNQLSKLYEKIQYLKTSINYENLKIQLKELEEQTQTQNFWDNSEKSTKILKTIKNLKQSILEFCDIENKFKDVSDLVEMLILETDNEMQKELEKVYSELTKQIDKKEIEILLNEEYDENDAILTLHAGAGGKESQDWVEMLYRMYTKYCQKQNFKITVLDFLDDDAGLKNITFLVEGYNAYGYLKGESGVHRLVRISPFDSFSRRHTSFVALEVVPNIDDDVNIDIRDDELKVDTFKASGAGGQHINKTESAVRITHLPTGIVVSSQSQRSQKRNKDICLKLLKSKLIKIKEQENLSKISDIKGVQKDNGFGSQIRSYIFMPYTLVKDHRTNFEKGNVEAVMNGEITEFISEYLKQKKLGKL